MANYTCSTESETTLGKEAVGKPSRKPSRGLDRAETGLGSRLAPKRNIAQTHTG